MKHYNTFPFSFHKLISKEKLEKKPIADSIRNNIKYLILTRVGDFAFDKKMGFEMWDYDKMVFYHEKEPYFESDQRKSSISTFLENSTAEKSFSDNLLHLIQENEVRLQNVKTEFKFDKLGGQKHSVYQRLISIKVNGKIKSTGLPLKPEFTLKIFFTPFKVET